jgi:hypothetical protein
MERPDKFERRAQRCWCHVTLPDRALCPPICQTVIQSPHQCRGQQTPRNAANCRTQNHPTRKHAPSAADSAGGARSHRYTHSTYCTMWAGQSVHACILPEHLLAQTCYTNIQACLCALLTPMPPPVASAGQGSVCRCCVAGCSLRTNNLLQPPTQHH